MHASDLGPERGVPDRPRRRRPSVVGVVGARGDLGAGVGEDPADRLDPEPLLVVVDVGAQRRNGRSSSAAKKADADLRISFARRSSRTSRSSSAIRCRSSVEVPGRWPASTSA